MSAPKDNKERADSTYVQRRNNRAADQDRRKHILYGVVGGVIAVLAIALLVWDSGFFQKRSTAVTIDGEDFLLHQGQSIVMPAGHPHSVYGQENFKMLLVVVF